MCGLAGFWEQGGPATPLEAVAARMAACIRHRGPDDGGVWVDPDAGIALAHRRLSIIDLSSAGHQPMHSAGGRYVLAYNGEVYNHLELRARLDAEGRAPAWRGHSDTETLLACIEAWGLEAALRASVGMFAFALWDRAERTLCLARDRLGEKPLYYGWQGNNLLFGSELGALKAHPAFNAAVDRDALALLLCRNYVPAPHSIYAGIRKLLPGHFLVVAPGQRALVSRPYWSLEEAAAHGLGHPFEGSDDDAVEALSRQLGAAVRGQMMADVPLGALLSGGIDSSTVTALMQANSTRPVRTFTIGFDEADVDESAHARAVAAHLGTDHTELHLRGQDALDLVPALPAIYDEPFADSSQLPTYLVMKLARAQVTVALSGDGGDESFGGYNRYLMAPLAWKRVGWLPAPLRRLAGGAMTALPAPMLNRWFGGLGARAGIAQPGDKMHKLGRRLRTVSSVDDLYRSLLCEWPLDRGLVVGAGAAPADNRIDDHSRWPAFADPVARMMLMDGATYLPDDILVKVDRASMAVSLETRAPMLDHRVVEFAWTLPPAMKVRGGQGKWLLRQLLYRHVPRALVERPKMGFGIPLDAWLRGPLRDWAAALLDPARLRREGYFDPAPIASAWHAHLRGEASNGYRLWSVLMFQAWLENESATQPHVARVA
jgi:asparagine synthase (glutamine-hydrolysing)